MKLRSSSLCAGVMLWVVAHSFSLVTRAAADPAPQLKIEVRGSVDDLWNGVKKKRPTPHGKKYYLASLKHTESDVPLIRPVDEAVLRTRIEEELNRNGFKKIGPDDTPDVLLTILYGRGYLKNPYADSNMDEISPGPATVTLITPEQVFAHRQPDYEAKLQNAQSEKLFIEFRAWQFPKQRTDKPKALWRCKMILDDPTANDLNEVAQAMLRAGGPQFDRNLDPGGIVVTSDGPAGKVILAPLKVLEEEKAAPAKPRAKSK